MGLEVGPSVVPPLANPFAVDGKPGAALLDDVEVRGQIDDFPGAADAVPIKNVELDLAKRSRKLVLHDLDAGAIAHRDRVLARRDRLFDGADAADVEAHGSVEFKGISARRGLGAAEH